MTSERPEDGDSQPGDYTPEELRRELFGDGPGQAALGRAAEQAAELLVASLRAVLNGTFDAFGFDYRRRPHDAEIPRQIRATADQRRPALPTEADLADIACAVFDTFSFPHDRAEVRAEVARQWRLRRG